MLEMALQIDFLGAGGENWKTQLFGSSLQGVTEEAMPEDKATWPRVVRAVIESHKNTRGMVWGGGFL